MSLFVTACACSHLTSADCLLITQCSSTANQWSSNIGIHKETSGFTFSFNLNLSSKDMKGENMSKSNCTQNNWTREV